MKRSGAAADGPNISIVNGAPARECGRPYQVGLTSSRGSGRIFCGGTLVSSRWVLSAAHCFDRSSSAWVVAGQHSLRRTNGNEQWSRSSRVHKHPRYNRNTMSYDFAMIELQTAMRLNSCVSTARLPSSDASPGTRCWISGWGTLRSGGSSPDILQEAQVTILSNRDCGSYGSRITSSMICAQGSRNGQPTDACQGDSGGPLVCNNVVYGATSWGRGCAERQYPGVYARVYHERSWIQRTMQQR